MRKTLTVVAALGLALSACAQNTTPPSSGGNNCATSKLPLVHPGQLTVATDSPAYSPWFRHNDPSDGQGYESAVAYAVADGLGFPKPQLKWVVEPFNKSYAPGPKDFDFALEQISITPERQKAVTFSHGYYNDQQALIAIKGTSTANVTQKSQLADTKLGAQVGTTSLRFITSVLHDQNYAVYDTTSDAKSALENGQIDGMILDLPTASYVQYSIKGATLVGKFPYSGEQFGLLFQKGNSLVDCVNRVVDTLRTDGTFSKLASRWLQNYIKVPTIS